MSNLRDRIVTWFYESYNTSWNWLNQLDRQEWLMLLLVGMVVGFFCMRGFGSRSKY